MARAPVVLAAHAGISEALAKQSSFDARTREAIALAGGARGGFDYCQAAHTPSAINSGLSEPRPSRSAAETSSSTRNSLRCWLLLRQAAANVGEVSDATWSVALAGWSEVELSEAFAHLPVNLFTNYFNHYARTDLDLPAAAALTP